MLPSRSRRVGMAGLLIIGLAGQACGSSSSSGVEPSTKPTIAPSPSPQPPDQVGTTDSYKFVPAHLEVTVGTTVTWRETTKYTPHNVRLDGDPANQTHDLLQLDESWSFTFTRAGTYAFVCTIHAPDMKGEVVVK